jgi:hypothetical protein
MIFYHLGNQWKNLHGMKSVSQVLKTTLQLQLDPCKPVDQLEYRVIIAFDMSSYKAYIKMKHFASVKTSMKNLSFTRSRERWPFLYMRENDR